MLSRSNGNPIRTLYSESQHVRQTIIALGVDNYSKQLILQTNGLTAAKEEPRSLVYDLEKSYGGKVVIGKSPNETSLIS